jgi:nitrogenase subunit NifH
LNKLETDRGDEVRDLESQMDPESQLNSHVISILPDENITQFNECTEKSVEEVTRSSELEESSESISKPNKNEFSSLCIVHGLMR